MKWRSVLPLHRGWLLCISLLLLLETVFVFSATIFFINRRLYSYPHEKILSIRETFETSFQIAYQNSHDIEGSFFLSFNIAKKQHGPLIVRMLDLEHKTISTYPSRNVGNDNAARKTFLQPRTFFISPLGKEWSITLEDNKLYYFEIFLPWSPLDHMLPNMVWQFYIALFFIVCTFLGALYWVIVKAMKPINQISIDIERIKYSLPSTWKPLRQSSNSRFLNNVIVSINELIFRAQRSLVCQENIGRFLAHEIKTPLTNLMNEIELETGIFPGRQVKRTAGEFCSQAIQDIMKIKSIVNNICELSYADSAIYLDKEVKLVELLSSFIHDFDHVYKFKAQLEVNGPTEHSIVRVNPDYFWILCSNILRNSIEHGNARKMKSLIRLSDENDRYRIEFIDWGKGFPFSNKVLTSIGSEENLNQLLRSYGSGLVLCLKLVEIMNMDIKLENKISQGACVNLWISKE